jgi:hypothetical protein
VFLESSECERVFLRVFREFGVLESVLECLECGRVLKSVLKCF